MTASEPQRHRTAPRRTHAALGLVATLSVAAWALFGCGTDDNGDTPARDRPRPEDPLLIVDGVTVTFADVAPLVDALDRLAPEYSERQKILRVLPEFTLPLIFARREFAERRAAQFALAETVRQACQNVEELDRNTHDRVRHRAQVSRGDVELPIAEFLFDPANVLAVSQLIEIPRGWVLAGAFDLQQQRAPIEDTCDALQVGFLTHPANEWSMWLASLRERLADKVTYVHPDYRLAMPPWMKLP